jgi:hypothetical protein
MLTHRLQLLTAPSRVGCMFWLCRPYVYPFLCLPYSLILQIWCFDYNSDNSEVAVNGIGGGGLCFVKFDLLSGIKSSSLFLDSTCDSAGLMVRLHQLEVLLTTPSEGVLLCVIFVFFPGITISSLFLDSKWICAGLL